MSKSVGIVDLFSGPGGLGEGFSSFSEASGDNPFSIEVSIEKEKSAHATLQLRSFLRKFAGEVPKQYYEFLNGKIEEPDWPVLFPEEWSLAEQEARCLELGSEETALFLKDRIEEIRSRFGDNTLLIGGPPCQAYSLAGRSRNAGIVDYVPHKDERNFLYEQYVSVLSDLKPAAFVMENVKGMLSSAIKGDMIFQKVMSDLRAAGGQDNYRLFALSPNGKSDDLSSEPLPTDFVVRTEDHGVPQARHRVIIVGLRKDIAVRIPSGIAPRLSRSIKPLHVKDVIKAMPRLRSGLSKGDGIEEWRHAVKSAVELIKVHPPKLEDRQGEIFQNALKECVSSSSKLTGSRRGSVKGARLPASCPDDLAQWIRDPKLRHLPNNETRGHMPSDLARYLFVAAFGEACGRSPKASEFPDALAPNHRSWKTGKFSDRFRVQVWDKPASTITSHISKDGHYFIHPDPKQCRSLTVREAARLQTFPDNYYFKGNRTQQYVQVGNAVPPFLAHQIAESIWRVFEFIESTKGSADQEEGNSKKKPA